ncbi:MAG: plasmid pRiA4b ORF-3 family protein, partial [Xanthobacteraceae bacterium]
FLEHTSEQNYPFCVDGHEACPPEDCGGPDGYLTQREAWHSMDALDDLGVMAEIVEQAVIEGRREVLDDANTRSQLAEALERAKERERWKGRPFSRRAVNDDFQQGRHLVVMHQQY